MEGHLNNLQGRIIALELLMRGFIAKTAGDSQPGDPIAFLDEWKKAMFQSAQNLNRPVDEYADDVWGEAISALNLTFDSVKERLSGR